MEIITNKVRLGTIHMCIKSELTRGGVLGCQEEDAHDQCIVGVWRRRICRRRLVYVTIDVRARVPARSSVQRYGRVLDLQGASRRRVVYKDARRSISIVSRLTAEKGMGMRMKNLTSRLYRVCRARHRRGRKCRVGDRTRCGRYLLFVGGSGGCR